MIIKIARDYTPTPGARYITDGPFSGEDFRDNILEKKYLECILKKEQLIIDLDGGYGYPAGFLEETFGGMIRKGYSMTDLLRVIQFVSQEELDLIPTILSYMSEEEARQAKIKEKGIKKS